jgi:hypothetical protein
MTWVFAFGLVISSMGLSVYESMDRYFAEVIQDNFLKDSIQNALAVVFLRGITLAILWSLLIAGFAILFRWVLTWQTAHGWPRYFFYAFKFSDGKAIAGWARITLDPSNGVLDASGTSFEADHSLTHAKCVNWISDIVSGGRYRGDATCYILYSLNRAEAEAAKRPYRDGLLRFRLLQRADLKEGSKWPEPSQSGEDQYFGHQQAIDKDHVWNLAYAESAHIDGETDVAIEKALTKELHVRRESLLEVLANLATTLKNSKT